MAKHWRNLSKARRKLEEAGDQYERWVMDAEAEWERRGWPIEDLHMLLEAGREVEVERALGGPPPMFVSEVMRAGVPGRFRKDGDLRVVGSDEPGGEDGT